MTSFKRALLRSAIAVAFSAILLIPRLRKLRRTAAVWNVVRAVCLACGVVLVWRGLVSNAGAVDAALVIPGIGLILLGSLVRARPLQRAVDDVARELEALVVLNGGTLIACADGSGRNHPAPQTNIFVSPHVLRVLDSGHQKLLEIPVAGIREIAVQSDPTLPDHGWSLRIVGESGVSCFLYEGVFAEHLARIAEKTVLAMWKKGLPVIGPR